MTNSLADLNTHLFAQLDRLACDGLTPEQIEQEAKRAQSIVAIADQVSATARLQLTAATLFAQHGKAVLPMLPQIGNARTIEGKAEDAAG
ncbi:hypothetical protein AQS8620_01329 [Aquimixticola soesokkakensis]|uniref:Uncharacterized protein n=1 Tax=Aquimixticola soesokkakensis TaxID=1519096 RepID=A0A1Y5SC03_9RHOB|nr:hypothetical protein [Aquimixticola soesokkakensis]SLN36916.1 hypothetical protein AQS8620_01329 [Aquimixticola soesokkakensis]